MKLEKEDKKIIITSDEGRFEALFNIQVRDLLLFHNKILVRLDTLGRKDINLSEKNRNVFCLNKIGKIIWQIEDADNFRTDSKKTDSPFVGWIIKGDIVRITNWNSFAYDLDMETGKLSNQKFTK